MKLEDFNFELPEHLIAKHPLDKRIDSRLLVYQNQKVHDKNFTDICDYLNPGDILVRNNSKVIPARLFVEDEKSQKKIEILITKPIYKNRYQIIAKPARKLKDKAIYYFDKNFFITIHRNEDQLEIEFNDDNAIDFFGAMPIPPYFKRDANEADKERYQTVYAKESSTGFSVAAPTAGLHFTEEIFEKLKQKGVEILDITLHVGLGTFAPIKSENIVEHQMHSEFYEVSQNVFDKINKAKNANKKIFAVGSTSVRTLETVFNTGQLRGDTNIFIYPGYQFKIVDAMITNFHLPKSSLILMVSAFIGSVETQKVYHHAIQNSYRFYSYGDASLLML